MKVKRVVRRKQSFKKKRVAKRTVSLAVKKYVKKTLAVNTENKAVQINGGYSFGNINESPDLNAYPMLPMAAFWSIPQGLGQGGRIGNEIKIRKLMLNYVIRPNPYDAVSNVSPQPCEIDLFLGYVRATPTTLPVAADLSVLFQNGSSVSAPVGSLRDIISVVNTDSWVIKKRWRHKVGYSSANGTGALAGNQTFNNNDFKLNVVRKINITNLINKTLRFNDGNNQTLTKNLYFMQQAVSASGAAFAATQLPMNIEFWIDVQFEDA